MLVKRNAKEEEAIIEELVNSDEELRKQHELFLAEMAFKQELIDARKSQSMTQKDISNMTGLSQQAVSRLEKSASGTLKTMLKYLNSLGYTLSIKKIV